MQTGLPSQFLLLLLQILGFTWKGDPSGERPRFPRLLSLTPRPGGSLLSHRGSLPLCHAKSRRRSEASLYPASQPCPLSGPCSPPKSCWPRQSPQSAGRWKRGAPTGRPGPREALRTIPAGEAGRWGGLGAGSPSPFSDFPRDNNWEKVKGARSEGSGELAPPTALREKGKGQTVGGFQLTPPFKQWCPLYSQTDPRTGLFN